MGCALVAWGCAGLGCDQGDASDKPIDQAPLDARIVAAEVALRASGGHDYGAITGLLEEYYGDEAVTTHICTQFIDAPRCFRITAVSIGGENTDPQWQEHFCGLEKQAWKSMWQSSMTADEAEQSSQGHFEECMMGLPFFVY